METMEIINPLGEAVTTVTARVEFTYEVSNVLPMLLADRDDDMKDKAVTFAELMMYVKLMAMSDFVARPFPLREIVLADQEGYEV